MILVFGKDGQVAKELELSGNVVSIGRNEVDLSNPSKCGNLIRNLKPNYVINAAAYTDVEKAENELKLATKINADSPKSMADACAELKIPFVHLSTEYVFSGIGDVPWKPNDFTNPQNNYGISKLAGEKAICMSGANFVILRTSWIFSSHRKNFLKTVLDLSKNQNEVSIVKDQIGGPTFAKDIASVCLKLILQLGAEPKKSGIYHFCGKPFVSRYEFSKLILDLIGSKTRIKKILSKNLNTNVRRPLNSRMDCDKIKKIFGIPQPNWKTGLKKTLKQLKAI
jgi:dTDP-4-dehydrorhamnose reductase